MTITVNVLPESAAPAPAARTAASAVSSTVVNDLGALARQQLPTAVPATALIAAYSGNVNPPPKLAVRVLPSVSSSLAAQFIAQTPEATAEDLEIFIPLKPATTTTPANEGDDYLSAMRMARDFSEVSKAAQQSPAAKPSQTAIEAANREAVANSKLPSAGTPTDITVRSNVVSLTNMLPAVLTQPMKKPNLSNVRGVNAYQLAQTRNATIRRTEEFAPA